MKLDKNKERSRARKRHFRKITRPIIVGLAFIIMLSVAMSIYFTQEERFRELEMRNQELQTEKKAAVKNRDELKELLENWDTPEYIEKIAREEFGLVKPGEILFVD